MTRLLWCTLTMAVPLVLGSADLSSSSTQPQNANPTQMSTEASSSEPTSTPLSVLQESPGTNRDAGDTKPVDATHEQEQERPLYFSIAVKGDMTVPIARVNPGFGAHLDVRYILPWMNPWFSVGIDAAWYRLSGKGTQNDPQIGLYRYSWTIDAVPINIGAAIEINKPLDWLVFIGGCGFSIAWARSNGEMFGGTTFAEDIAFGYYVHGGVEFRFLPYSGVTVEYRHSGFYLDFDYPHLNTELGDIGGAMVLVGYKYTY